MEHPSPRLPTPALQEDSLGREQAFPMLISKLPVSRMVHTLPKQYIASVPQSRCSADVSSGQQQDGCMCKLSGFRIAGHLSTSMVLTQISFYLMDTPTPLPSQ